MLSENQQAGTPARKKVLMVLMGLDIGGAETHVVGLSSTLLSMGWEVVVASAGGIYEQKLQELGIRHYLVPTATKKPSDMLTAIRRLSDVIRREKPDVVHAHARIPAMLCGLLQPRLHFTFVTTAHWTFTVNPLLQKVTNWGQQTIAVSDDIRQYLIENYGIPYNQIHVTVNGIDMADFSPATSPDRVIGEFGINRNGPVIVCVTRFHESRVLSARLLTEIAQQLAGTLPGLQILLVGDGDCMAELKEKAEAANSALGYNCVILTGARTDISQLINAGDVFVGVSRAALEAMSCEKPTILCGNEGYNGIVVPEKLELYRKSNFCCRDSVDSTAELLAEDLRKLFGMSEAARRKLGRDGRQIIYDHYSLQTMAEDCIHAYEEALHPRRRIVISGYYGFNNMGDDSILHALTNTYGSQYHISVLSKHPLETAAAYQVAAVPRFSLRQVKKALRDCDLLISGGGSLLQDRTSTRSLLYYLWIISFASRHNKPVFIYANGIGPLNHKLNRLLTVKVLSRVPYITVRDSDSAALLKSLGITDHLYTTADPIFLTDDISHDDGIACLRASGIPTEQPLWGISLRTLPSTSAAQFAEYINGVCAETHVVPVFLCMQPQQDSAITKEVVSCLNVPSHILDIHNSSKELINALSCMELVTGMRLHAIIMSAAAGTPVIGFDYDPKINALLDALGLPLLHIGKQFDPSDCISTTVRILAHRAEIAAQLESAVTLQRSLALQNDTILQELLSALPDENA